MDGDARSVRGPVRTAALLLFALGMGLLLYSRFNAVNSVILPFLQRAADPSLYGLDVYVRQSIVPASTPLFDLLALLRFDLTAPVFIIPTYLVVTLISATAVWRILGRSFGVGDTLLRTALLFALAFADFKITGFNKSSWMLEHNFSFTFLAAALRFWFLAFLLERRVVAATLLLVPINILSFKVGWPLVGFVGLALIGWRERSPAAWGLLAASLVVPAWAALRSVTHLSSDETAFVFDTFNSLHAGEDNPFAGPPLQMLLFIGGMAFALWRLRALPRALTVPVASVLLGSALIWLVGGVYLTFLGEVLPFPLAVLLSPARALELAGLLIYLIVLLWIADAPGLGGVERVLLALAAIILKVTPNGKWVVVALVIAMLAVGLLALRWLARKRGLALAGLGEHVPLTLGLAALALPIGLLFALNVSGQRTSYRLDSVLGFYDSAIPGDAIGLLRTIAAEPNDRPILVVSRQKDWAVTNWNYLARKSGIVGDAYYLPLPDQIRAQMARNAVSDKIVDGLRKGDVEASAAADLSRLHATLIVPEEAVPALIGWRIVGEHGSWKEVTPP